jgi:hypothetical protein
MKDIVSQLPYLVRLLDDDSPAVRETVLRELGRFGPSLEQEIDALGIVLTPRQSAPIQSLLERGRREELRKVWSGWFGLKQDKLRLETALSMIVELQQGKSAGRRLPGMLDHLANEYGRSGEKGDALRLATFLFKEKGLSGVSQEEYLNPLNSNLLHVIEERKGLPISLACIYILVGHRLNLSIEGCNFPGHFLAVAPSHCSRVLVDCYNGGRTIDQHDLSGIGTSVTMKDLLRLECGSWDIVARVLRNLRSAYEHTGNTENVRLMTALLEMMNT